MIGLTEGGSLLSLSWEELELLVAGPGLTLGVHPEELTDAIVVAVGYTGWEGSTLMGTVVTMVARWDVGEVIVWEVTRGEAGVTDPWKAAKDRNDHVYNNQTGHVGLTGGSLLTPYMSYSNRGTQCLC